MEAGFITVDRLEAMGRGPVALRLRIPRTCAELADAIRRDLVEVRSNRKIGNFIDSLFAHAARPASSAPAPGGMPRSLQVAPEARAESRLYKKIALELVFRSPQLQQLDFKADEMLADGCCSALAENYLSPARGGVLRLLPAAMKQPRRGAGRAGRRPAALRPARVLTDASATRLYRRLFEPHFGGLADLL